MLQIKVLTESSIFSGSEIVGQNSQSVYVLESVTLADQILQDHRDAAEAAASAAYQSEVNAAVSAAAAAASELQTDEDRRAVENDKLLTAGYRDEAAASAAAADTSEANAKTSETNAAASASNAAASATSASGSASTATQKATEAAAEADAAAAAADRSQVAADEATQMLDDFRNVSSVSGNLAVGGTISEAGVNLGSKYAEIAYVDQSIADLIGGAPETLDTLEEIAAILEENDSAMDSMLALIDTKLTKTGDTMTGDLKGTRFSLTLNESTYNPSDYGYYVYKTDGGLYYGINLLDIGPQFGTTNLWSTNITTSSQSNRWISFSKKVSSVGDESDYHVFGRMNSDDGQMYLQDGTKKVYHQGFKPTPKEIGAPFVKGPVNFDSPVNLKNGPIEYAGGNITTQQFLDLLDSMGAFNQFYWISKSNWTYASNDTITDTGCGNIHLAGNVVEVFTITADGNQTNCTIRITGTPTTSVGGLANGQWEYVNHGASYAPGWRRIYNTKTPPTPVDIGAVNKAGDNMTGNLTVPVLTSPSVVADAVTTDSVAFGAATIIKTDEGISFNV